MTSNTNSNPWYVLKIEKTDDQNAIKAAYMALLPNHNPETDPDGFTNLRLAYEAALKEASTDTPKANDPVSIFFATLEDIYKDFAKRIDPATWEEALQSDVCTALDTEEEVDAKMMDFISKHHNLPTNVWDTLNNRFQWTARVDELCKRYSPGFINAIVGSVGSKFDLFFNLFDYEPGADVDKYIYLRNIITKSIDANKKDEAESQLAELKALPVSHPIYDIEMARFQSICNKDSEAALQLLESVMEKHPQFKSEPFAVHTKAFIMLGLENKAHWQEALETYKAALEIVPTYYYAQLGIVDSYVRLEDYVKAERYLIDVMLLENPSNNYLYAYMHHITGLKREKYEKLYNDEPTPEVTKLLAEAYAFGNEHDKCIEVLDAKTQRGEELCGKENFLLGRCYKFKKEFENAIKYTQMSIDTDPEYSKYYQLANIYLDKRKYDETIQAADTGLNADLLEKDTEILSKARLYTTKAYAYNQLGKYSLAMEEIEKALTINTKMADVYADKAETLMNMNKLQDAYNEAVTAMNMLPTWPKPYELQANIFYWAKSFAKMDEVFQKADEAQIKSPGLTYFKGCKAGANKDYDQCQEILKNLLDEENLGIWEDRALDALCHYMSQANDYEAVAVYAARLIEFLQANDFSPTASSYIYLATAHKHFKNSEKQLEALTEGLKALPDNSRLLTQLGYYHDDAKSPERYETWKRMLTAYPQNPLPYSRLAVVLDNEDKSQEAIDLLNQGLEQIPGSINLIGRRAYIYLSVDDSDKAASDFLHAAENPQNQASWWVKGTMYYEAASIFMRELNDAEKGIKYYLLANDHGGINSSWRKSSMANIYELQKDYEKAIALYTECLDDKPNDYDFFSRGRTYKLMGEAKKAQADFDKVIELATAEENPTHHTYRWLGNTYLELDNPALAKECFEKAEKTVKTDGTKDGICFCVYQNWAKYYKYIGEHEKALEQILLAIKLTNSVWNDTLKREIEESLGRKDKHK